MDLYLLFIDFYQKNIGVDRFIEKVLVKLGVLY